MAVSVIDNQNMSLSEDNMRRKCPRCGNPKLGSIEVLDYGQMHLIFYCEDCGMMFN